MSHSKRRQQHKKRKSRQQHLAAKPAPSLWQQAYEQVADNVPKPIIETCLFSAACSTAIGGLLQLKHLMVNLNGYCPSDRPAFSMPALLLTLMAITICLLSMDAIERQEEQSRQPALSP